MDTEPTDPKPNGHLAESRIGMRLNGTGHAGVATADAEAPACPVERVDIGEDGTPAAEEQVSLITAALETLRLAPNADTFVREALGTIVARLGGCGGALWTVGAGMHDTRVATDYDREHECYRSSEELEDDHPGKRSQPFPPEVVERWRRHQAEPVLIPANAFDGSEEQCARFNAWARRLGVHSVLLVPLVFGDEVLGALTVRFREPR